MINLKKTILLVSILTISIALFQTACNKDPTKVEEKPIVSTTGEAIIGKIGGTISVGDVTSTVYGASIEIPKDALVDNVKIEIVPGTEEYFIDGVAVQTVSFLPKGLEFKDLVEIGIPWSTDDQTISNSSVYYLDTENSLVQELPIERVDIEKKMTYVLINHFSTFFNARQVLSIDYGLMKANNELVGYCNLYTPISQILPKMIDSPYANAEEIVLNNDGLQDCFVMVQFDLFKKDNTQQYYSFHVARQDFYIKYHHSADGWEAIVYRYDNPLIASNQLIEVYHKTGLTTEDFFSDWLSGFPILASFNENCFSGNNYPIQNVDHFHLWANWSLVKNINPIGSSQSWTWRHGGSTRYNFSLSDVSENTDDSNNNNIDDFYEDSNNSPYTPSNPLPANNATNVTITSDLSWECSDPEGDAISYKIYFGTNANPALAGTAQDVTTFTPVGLVKNTTYYWYIEATDSEGLSTTGPIWSFITEAGSASTGCDGITTVEYAGQTYHTVEIGDQCWLKENLNVGTMINGTTDQTDNNTIEKYCYENDVQNCTQYGGLYQWDEMMQYVSNEGAKGICPSGWHLPSSNEWKTLEGTVDSQYGVGDPVWDNADWRGFDAGKKLKASSGWGLNGNGTDSFGFTMLPAGYWSDGGLFSDKGIGGFTWNSSASVRSFAFNNDGIMNSFKPKKNGYSVRCLRD